MAHTLIIKEEAANDIKEAYLYYEEQKAGLGVRFLNTLEIHLERVKQYPEHYQIKRPPYREAFVKDFPYLIVYELEATTVIVYAVFNTWKNPAKKTSKK